MPSPKFQRRLLMFPVEVLLKVTTKGATPDVALAVKLATGAVVDGMVV